MVFLSSCLTTANFETGKTVGRGMTKNDIAINYEFSEPKTTGWFEFNEAPFVNYGFTYGLHDRVDLGFNINMTDLSLKTKVMLTKRTSPVSVSLGTSVYFIFGEDPLFTYYHTNLSLYTSLNPTDEFTLYLNPQVLFMANGILEDKAYAITVGFMFNKVFKTKRHNIGLGFEFTNHEMGIYKQHTFAVGVIIKRKNSIMKSRKKDPLFY
jgi:hypothetical protein